MPLKTFGRTTTGATNLSFPIANNKTVSRFALSEAGQVVRLVAQWNTAHATAKVKGVIYADAAGTPGALVAVTSERVGVGVGWNDLPFASPVALGAGTYHLGVISDTGLTSDGAASTGTNNYNADTYSDGASDPFGTPTSSTVERPVHAVYLTGEDVAVSKAVGYVVLTAPQAAVAKATGYAVLSTEVNVSVAKAVAYAVLAPPPALAIESVVPNTGPAAGGTRVRVTYRR